jgi:hypothetical protein
MSTVDTERLAKLVEKTRQKARSKEKIKATFEGAGIIDKKGNLKKPYKDIYFPAQQ